MHKTKEMHTFAVIIEEISNAMKTIKVPFLKDVQQMSLEQISALLDETGSRLSIDQVNWKKQYPYMPFTSVYLLHDSEYIYIKWHVNGIMLKGVYTEDLQPVHEDSCVEFFCKQADSDHYINFEFNCLGTCSASLRLSKTEDVKRLSKDELESIKRFSTLGRRPFCEINGQFVWSLCVAIPLSLIHVGTEDLRESDVVLQGNFYKCADDTSSKHYVSWSAINTPSPSFHEPKFFGKIVLESIGE